MSTRPLLTFALCASLTACASANPTINDAAAEAAVDTGVGAAPDVTSAADAASDASAPSFPTLNDCAEAEYVDLTAPMAARTVVPMGSTGYTPRCLTIAAGQSVTFSMDFTVHPLAAGIAHGSSVGASSPNPIAAQTTGSMYSAQFATPGFYPFKCSTHQHVGMAGVVRVVPAS